MSNERKVAIVGYSSTSRMLTPCADPTWEVWAHNDIHEPLARVTRHFELHEEAEARKRWSPEYYAFLCGEHAGTELITGHANPNFKVATLYPWDAILQQFGGYFTCSTSLMIALALHEGVTDIALYGIDMSRNDPLVGAEYAHQRPSCEYILGIACGLGVKIHIPATSDLLKTPRVYAMESPTGSMVPRHRAMTDKLNNDIATVDKHIADLEAKLDLFHAQRHGLVGARSINEHWLRMAQ